MTASLKTHAWELMALALFYFVFLGGEYFFDATLASFMSPADVVLNQGMYSARALWAFAVSSLFPERREGCVWVARLCLWLWDLAASLSYSPSLACC